MTLSDTLSFVENTRLSSCFGKALPYFTIIEIQKVTKKDYSGIRKQVKLLIQRGMIVEHPLNDKLKVKRFRLVA
jgi:hypothetical protein